MDQTILPGLLMRVAEWHAHSVEVAGDLEAAGHTDLARRVASDAADTLMKVMGTPARRASCGLASTARGTATTSPGRA